MFRPFNVEHYRCFIPAYGIHSVALGLLSGVGAPTVTGEPGDDGYIQYLDTMAYFFDHLNLVPTHVQRDGFGATKTMFVRYQAWHSKQIENDPAFGALDLIYVKSAGVDECGYATLTMPVPDAPRLLPIAETGTNEGAHITLTGDMQPHGNSLMTLWVAPGDTRRSHIVEEVAATVRSRVPKKTWPSRTDDFTTTSQFHGGRESQPFDPDDIRTQLGTYTADTDPLWRVPASMLGEDITIDTLVTDRIGTTIYRTFEMERPAL